MRIFFLSTLMILALTGCGVTDAVVEQYDDLTVAYHDTIYDKSHQLEEYGLENPNQEKLARLMTPVDGPLGALIRYVSDRDFYPDETWVELLFARFPWINSLFITDPEGWMLDRYPNDPIKRISSPLQFEAVWRETFIQTRVDYPELGPELYLGTPMFKDADFKGLIVVSFDPRTLFSFCPNPEELIIIHPGGGVWSMDKNVDAEALKQVPWDELLKDAVQGEVEAGGVEYTWLARYVGSEPYLYAVRSIVEP